MKADVRPSFPSEENVRRMAVQNCARCRKDHHKLNFRRFTRPIVDNDGTIWDWWAFCPTTLEPVMMRDVEQTDGNKDL